MLTEKDQKILEKFIKKTISDEDIKLVKERIEQDEEFKKEYEYLLSIKIGLEKTKKFNEKKKYLKSISKQKANPEIKTLNPKAYNYKSIFYIAASFTLILGLGIYFSNINTVEPNKNTRPRPYSSPPDSKSDSINKSESEKPIKQRIDNYIDK